VKVYSVSELTREISALLTEKLANVWVQGEISNLRTPESGHIYFSLTDPQSQLRCVLFRSNALALWVDLVNGMKIRVFGRIGVYERDGVYQLYAEEIRPVGVGELAIRFEKLKRRLQAEGLFDAKHKKPLPVFPERIGVVTSPTGAALQDIIKVARRRCPSCRIVLNPVRVQGHGAAEEIAHAIGEFNEYGRVELLIVGRGGGSTEDLWPFNEEVVARAIFGSAIPVVSAVGHEIDFTIADFTADARAATPSAAVEQILPDRKELALQIDSLTSSMTKSLRTRVDDFRRRLKLIQASYAFRRPREILIQRHQAVDDFERSLDRSMTRLIGMWDTQARGLDSRLESLSPQGVLSRGYSISRKLPERKILRDAREVSKGDEVEIQLHKGRLNTRVTRRNTPS